MNFIDFLKNFLTKGAWKMNISAKEEANGQANVIQERINAVAFVKKPDFRGTSKWELVFLGKTIQAEIKDLDWLKKVRSGEITGFDAKATIPVRMLIEYDADANNEPIPNTHKYTVLKVTGNIIWRSEKF